MSRGKSENGEAIRSIGLQSGAQFGSRLTVLLDSVPAAALGFAGIAGFKNGTQIREYRCCLPKFSVLSTPEFQTVGFPLGIKCDSHLLKAATDGPFRGRIRASFREMGACHVGPQP